MLVELFISWMMVASVTTSLATMMHMFIENISVEFKPEDLWIGIFWRRRNTRDFFSDRLEDTSLDIWICLLPMLPIHVVFPRYEDYLS